MATKTYISVILPLKLEWEPCYALPEGLQGEGIQGGPHGGPHGGLQGGPQGEDPHGEDLHEALHEALQGDLHGDLHGEALQEALQEGLQEGLQGTENICIGDRVKVQFAGKTYSGAVTAVGIEPQTDPSKIKEIITVERGLERIRQEEITLWRKVAEYYMCSVGEVYKAAYPQRKIDLEEARAAALHKAHEKHEKMLNAMRAKVAKLKERLEEKEKALEKAKPGTKKQEQLPREIEQQIQKNLKALSAEAAQSFDNYLKAITAQRIADAGRSLERLNALEDIYQSKISFSQKLKKICVGLLIANAVLLTAILIFLILK